MSAEKTSTNHLIIVSNRLPIVLTREKDAQWQLKPGSGGLVTALAPVLRNRGGIWIGWPGTAVEEKVEIDELLAIATKDSGYVLEPVFLTN